MTSNTINIKNVLIFFFIFIKIGLYQQNTINIIPVVVLASIRDILIINPNKYFLFSLLMHSFKTIYKIGISYIAKYAGSIKTLNGLNSKVPF